MQARPGPALISMRRRREHLLQSQRFAQQMLAPDDRVALETGVRGLFAAA
jgi:hypothetical protein